jgi:flavin-dependent dehydrogenase
MISNNLDNLQDVIVIGGGPAGSTAATCLAMQGHSVTLLEKEKFPREHVGESLLPFCYDLFQELGVLDQLRARFVRKPGVRFINSDGSCYTSWCFNHVIKDESYLSFQVIRSEFDNLLLDNSRKHGVVVKEQTRVQSVDLERPDGCVEVRAIGPDGQESAYHSKFLVDASGRASFIATKKGWRKPHKGLERTALWTHWGGVKQMIGGLEEGLSIIIYLGGEKKGWMWVFPLDVDRVTIGVVVDTASLHQEKRRQEESGSEDWRLGLYKQEVMRSEFVRRLLDGAHITMPLMIEGDYSYYSEQKYGANFVMVGDASRFIDPIFSSGIYLSMKSSFLLSKVIHQKLTSPHLDKTDSLYAAYKQINGAYDFVYRLIRLYYNPHAINFAEAGIALQEHKSHESAMAAGHFMLAGDFFERHEEYSKFIDLLEDPSLFKGYRNYVVDRRNFQTSSCGMAPVQVFPSLEISKN